MDGVGTVVDAGLKFDAEDVAAAASPGAAFGAVEPEFVGKKKSQGLITDMSSI